MSCGQRLANFSTRPQNATTHPTATWATGGRERSKTPREKNVSAFKHHGPYQESTVMSRSMSEPDLTDS